MAAHDLSVLERLIAGRPALPALKQVDRLEDVVAHRSAHLTKYQDEAYARTYSDLVNEVAAREQAIVAGGAALAMAVARNLAKLMAYKDEYEVARLYSSPEFMASVRAEFTGEVKLKFNLAPPLLAKKDPQTGRLAKREYGSWMLPVFKVLAKLKVLRGTAFDVVGYTAERRTERQLITEYRDLLQQIMAGLTLQNHALAVQLANMPDRIRGYGHIKDRNVAAARQEQASLLERFRSSGKSDTRREAA